MMQDFEYDEYARQFEDTCKRIAPKRKLRVWRSEEAQKRMAKSGSPDAMRGAAYYPLFLVLELSLNVDGVEYTRAATIDAMKWLFQLDNRDDIARSQIDYLLSVVFREL